jgi:hypothetical protein
MNLPRPSSPTPAAIYQAVALAFDMIEKALGSPAGGSTPTGTGFRHVTAGAEDAASKLVDTADINADQVTYPKIQNVVANNRVLGRVSGAGGDIEELTGAQVATLAGVPPTPTGTGFTHETAGVQDAAAKLVDTADINNDQVTFAKLVNIATSRFIGRITGGSGDPEELTGTQATSLLDVFTAFAKGLVPISPGGSTQYLRADGTFAVPTASVALKTVEVSLGAAPVARRSGKFQIAVAGLTAGKPVYIQQANGPYTGKGTREDEAEMDQLRVTGKVLDATTIQCFWEADHRVRGNFKFNYLVSA